MSSENIKKLCASKEALNTENGKEGENSATPSTQVLTTPVITISDATNTRLEIRDAKSRRTRSNSSSVPADIICKIHSQRSRLASLKSVLATVEESRDEACESMLAQWRIEATDLMDTSKQVHSDIEATCTADLVNDPYFTQNVLHDIHVSYSTCIILIIKLEEKLKRERPAHLAQTSSARNSKLPPIPLPSFSGAYSEWPTFKEMFLGMVQQDARLPDVEKLHYLRTSLTGNALALVQGLPLIGASLAQSWDLLINRFENKRFIMVSHLEHLNSLGQAQAKNSESLNKLISSVSKVRKAVLTLTTAEQLGDCLLTNHVVRLLDRPSREAWETSLGNSQEFPTFDQLEEFLTARIRTLEQVDGHDGSPKGATKGFKAMIGTSASGTNTPSAQSGSRSSETVKPTHTDRIANQYPCSYCSETHFIVSCSKFRALSNADRRKFITSKSLCFNCFGRHRAAKCHSQIKCKECGNNHHTMIHMENSSTAGAGVQAQGAPAHIGTTQHVNSLLATAVAFLDTPTVSHQVRLLIDPGSELTFASEQLIKLLNLKRIHSSVPIIGIGGVKATHTHGKILIKLRSMHRNHQVHLTAHILRQLSSTLPSFVCNERAWPHINNLCLADSNFGQPRSIDLIIGADHYGSIIKPNIIRGSLDEPIAQLSIFGWLVLGPTQNGEISPKHVHHTRVLLADNALQDTLTKFWLMEEAPNSTRSLLTPEEALCEQHFVETHSRSPDGKYIVRLPLKEDISLLGNSLPRAQGCLKRTLLKFNREPEYKELYMDFMEEYAQLGHMVAAPTISKNSRPVFYLPHHGVLKTDSPTTKLRVVFNGSAVTSSGYSLNDIMHTGPNLLLNIVDVLTWIRSFKLVFATDITKMYRQILVYQDDWDLQRIIWIDDQLKEKDFQLTTVTYGTRAAPFLAIRVLHQLVQDEGHKYPLAVESLNNGRYVDDIFGGADTVDVLMEKASQLQDLCKAGGFPLAKWSSNDTRLTQKFSTPTCKDVTVSLNDYSTKILGLSWLPVQDVLTFTLKLPPPQRIITKRNLLSEVAQIYDPIGIISPVVINAKILLQELWLHKISWDEPIASTIGNKWLRIREDLAHLERITLPRWYGTLMDSTVEIHGFSDASQLAIAAVIYIRVRSSATGITSSFVCSKTKVAPLKHVTIPRLELAAAHLLTVLTQHFVATLKVKVDSVNLWTDSKVTLAWIRSHPSRWKDFVRYRVSYIQEAFPAAQWRHVPGTHNPADCASRGLLTSQLIDHELWWRGPEWLVQQKENWPAQQDSLEDSKIPEHRSKISLIATIQPLQSVGNLLNKYSSLNKLLRVTAWLFVAYERFKKSSAKVQLTTAIINKAKLYWIRQVQQHYFAEEIKLLENSSVPKWHIFNRLTAYTDSDGIIRVGGRLQRADLDVHSKHPAILPRKSTLSTLIIAQAHLDTLHGGTQLTLATIRQQFWIIGGRAPVKSHIVHCVTCARQRAARAQQLMGQLPVARVTPSRPFTHTGVDYAGPISIKAWKGRGSKTYKSWICAFVCFSSSAVHLEAVSDYTTDGFLAAYRRFSSRRGLPANLYSDCGPNFVGADKELKTLFNQAQTENSHLAAVLLKDGTQWNFNPPAAPHMGGKWEAVVKSINFHFRRTIGDTLLTFEELTTLLTQVECILNSRPLEPLSDDPEDQEVLTPGHFLIGAALNSPPELSLLNLAESRLSRWQLIQQKVQQFWKQWSTQYLQQRQAISKWHHPSHKITIGSMVLLIDEHLPPCKWPMARVTDVHPGEDGLTRVVTLKTATSQLVRHISKLVILPVYDQLKLDQPSG